MALLLVSVYLGHQNHPIGTIQNPIAENINTNNEPVSSVAEIPFLPGQTMVELSETDLEFHDNRGLLNFALSKYSTPVDLPPMTSIVATYWWADALYHADYGRFVVYKTLITEYFMTHYRTDTRSFSDHLDFTPFENFEGANLLSQAYSTEIVDWMVIAQLGQTGGLYSEFTAVDRNVWIDQILGGINFDGGFGSLHSPNSTLVETYFALGALDALLEGNLSSIDTGAITDFVINSQRTSSVYSHFYGPFCEYSTDEYFGWEYLWASWLGWEMLHILNATDQADKDLYIEFINDTSIYNEDQNCFRFHPNTNIDIFTPFGTVIIQNTISLMGAEDQFPQYWDNIEALENATYYSISGNIEGKNYWFYQSDSSSEDLFVQAMTYRYFSTISGNYSWQTNITDSNSLLDTLESFWSTGGGASFNLDPLSVETQAQYYLVQNTDMHRNEVLDWVVDLAGLDHFHVDQPNYLWFPYPQNNLDPLKVGYYCTQLLNRYDLWSDFKQTMENLDYNADILMWEYTKWFSDQFTEDWEGSISTLSYEGNLEHTWWLLGSQAAFISQNETLDFSYFYNSSEISNITRMIGAIYNFDGYFDDPYLGNFAKSTVIALRTYNLLDVQIGALLSIQAYFEEHLFLTLDPSPEELYWMLELVDLFEFPLYMDNPVINHSSVRDWCYGVINSPVIEFHLYQSLALLQNNPQKFLIYNNPLVEECIYGEIHTIEVQIASVFSLLQVSDMKINGESDVSQFLLFYVCETAPAFDPDHPEYTYDRIEFIYEGKTFWGEIPVTMVLEWSYVVIVEEETVTLQLNMVNDATQYLLPRLLVKEGDTPLFSVETAEFQIASNLGMTNFTWNIGDISSGNYTLIWEFG
ncbi:MAG: hypothetical protein ACTSYI_16975, partial [Promethearchaeota archaeon]